MNIGDELTRVLIADDDDDDFLIFTLAIEELSYKVMLSRATDAQMLMTMLNREVPDLLFLDLQLPRKGGRECLQQIRNDSRFDKLPVIVYTSLEDLNNIEYCFRHGANIYTLKPNTIRELKIILQRILTIDWKVATYYPPLADFVLRGEV